MRRNWVAFLEESQYLFQTQAMGTVRMKSIQSRPVAPPRGVVPTRATGRPRSLEEVEMLEWFKAGISLAIGRAVGELAMSVAVLGCLAVFVVALMLWAKWREGKK